jgi:hypothetical protein
VVVWNAVFRAGGLASIPSLASLLDSFMVGDYHFKYVIPLPFLEISSIKHYLVQKALPEEKRQKEVHERGKIPQSLLHRHKNINKVIT